MGWRTVVITKTSKLDYSLGYMVVRDVENTVKIHISEISILVVGSTSVSLTAYLLNELSKSKVKVIFCDEKGNPETLMLLCRILQKYIGTKLFVCCNLSAYFTEGEIDELSHMAESANIPILNIESSFITCCERNRISLIDNDLCEFIDSEE